MALLDPDQQRVARAIGKLTFGNPFVAERIELEREVLGDRFVPGQTAWSLDPGPSAENPNVVAINQVAESLLAFARQRLLATSSLSTTDRELYEGLVIYVLYYRCEDALYREIADPQVGAGQTGIPALFASFRRDFARFFEVAPHRDLAHETPEQLFALLFQHRRAFQFTFRHIFGSSPPAAALRTAVWESIFTHDMQRYRRGLYSRMHELATLITGPSGTGKELAAQAIGMSRFIPFDGERKEFLADYRVTFQPLNLSALSPTLIESELFGHQKGAFTGAVASRQGYLDRSEPWATVFLDEIGETDASVQLKLLRVLQTREFQKLGENRARRFGGKIIAATNVNLADEIAAGRFRADLYFRLCSDLITMPSLEQQIRAQPDELHNLVGLVAERVLGADSGPAVAEEVVSFIDRELGHDYPWPGNMRELEQCVRNVLVRKEYRPPQPSRTAFDDADPGTALVAEICRGDLTAEEVLSRYCTLVYAKQGSYEASARKLHLDRRTVKQKVDPVLLRALQERGGAT